MVVSFVQIYSKTCRERYVLSREGVFLGKARAFGRVKLQGQGKQFWQGLNLRRDPRLYQILVLSLLVIYGLFHFDFGLPLSFHLLILGTCLVTQALCTRMFKLPSFDPRSPLISGLSLCLLIRTNSYSVVALAAVIAISSKFLIRSKRRHIFNPTNFGIVLAILLTGQAWVSPGQWGSGAFAAFLFACAGMMVLYRTARSDVTFLFLASWAVLVLGKAFYLNDPWSIPIRNLQSGSLLLFAFFMISDPKTTPDSRIGRTIFAFLVASIAALLQLNWFNWYSIPILGWEIPVNWVSLRANGMFYALVLGCCTTPLINRFFPGKAYEWEMARGAGGKKTEEASLPALAIPQTD